MAWQVFVFFFRNNLSVVVTFVVVVKMTCRLTDFVFKTEQNYIDLFRSIYERKKYLLSYFPKTTVL